MAIDEQQLKRIEARFAASGFSVNERSRLQALVPTAARVLSNDYGSAPGLEFAIDEARVIVVPGVPSELKGIITDHVLPTLTSGDSIDRKTILVFGPIESELANTLADLAPLIDAAVSLAYLPSPGGIRLRAMRIGNVPDVVKRFESLVEGIRQRVHSWIVSEDGSLMPEAVGKALREHDMKLCTAESCTGGLIGKLLTDGAGSSDYYVGGVVSYSDSVKSSMLDVPAETIAKHGAVSEQVARAMSEGARKRLGADIAVSVTGVAGPGGGSDAKPVGTVWISVATEHETRAKLFHLGRERDVIRQRAAYIALNLVRRTVLGWVDLPTDSKR
ncbi:MAG: nicotinamide-nucleotide amidohydrolase family protein [bacterium]|nr:nicotinamide-nucleotide amidohydrolase family protein [Candidatus Kapabacteria bacterium]